MKKHIFVFRFFSLLDLRIGLLCWYTFFCASTYQEDTFSMKNNRPQMWAMKTQCKSPVKPNEKS